MTKDATPTEEDAHQRPDGTPKKTGRMLHEGIATVRADDDSSRSNYTIHVEHPENAGGVSCFHRNSREMVVSGVRKHLDRLADDQIERVDVIDSAGLELREAEIKPDSYDRTGHFGSETPVVEVGGNV